MRGERMHVNYDKDPSLREDKVDIHYREETEQIEVIRSFFSSLQSIAGRRKKRYACSIRAVSFIWKWLTASCLHIRRAKCIR